MKKYLCGAAVIFGIMGNANAVDVSKCETFGLVGPRGDWIVKCAPTDELRQIQAKEAKCKFLSAGSNMGLNVMETIIADTENIYINVVPGEFGPDTTGYRILQNIDLSDWSEKFYAVCTD